MAGRQSAGAMGGAQHRVLPPRRSAAGHSQRARRARERANPRRAQLVDPRVRQPRGRVAILRRAVPLRHSRHGGAEQRHLRLPSRDRRTRDGVALGVHGPLPDQRGPSQRASRPSRSSEAIRRDARAHRGRDGRETQGLAGCRRRGNLEHPRLSHRRRRRATWRTGPATTCPSGWTSAASASCPSPTRYRRATPASATTRRRPPTNSSGC